jgi:hypothetical protein
VSTLTSRVLAALAVAAGAAVLVAPRPVAVAGGLLLGFVLPGTALLGALFPRRTLSPAEQTVLAPALSMGVLITTGLAGHGLGLRLDRLTWTVATVGVTLVAVVVAQLRGRWSAPDEPAPHQPRPDVRRLVRQALPLALVAAVLGGSGWLSFDTSRSSHDTVVTALSATPSGPVNAAGNRTVRVTASGLLAGEGPYTVRVTGTARTPTVERTVAVTAAGTWTAALSMPGGQRMTVNLYRSGDTTAYRTLSVSAVE